MAILDLVEKFVPEIFARARLYREAGKPFVHYTSIEAGINVLKTKNFWLRNATCMNDYSEVVHGLSCLTEAYNDEVGRRLKSILQHVHPGMPERFTMYFNSIIPSLERDTYMTCLSEFDPITDRLGRLSMWRAYGATGGLAFVMDPFPFFNETDALEAYTVPVSYLGVGEFLPHFEAVVQRMADHKDWLSQYSEDEIRGFLYFWFRWVALCTKHPGFYEEREWRVVYSPTLNESELVKCSLENVRGVPQIVYNIELKDHPEKNLVGIEIPKLLREIIVGPTLYGVAVFKALVHLLGQAGVERPESRVRFSNIPVR